MLIEIERLGMATKSQPTGPLSELTGFQRDILAVVADVGTPYGLRIKRELEHEYQTEINHGRLYPNLNDLVEAGFLEKSERDKRTNEYTLSSAGRRALTADARWRREALGENEDDE